MTRIACLVASVGLCLVAAPAVAAPVGGQKVEAAAAEVPEPSDLALFGLGLFGVVMGYRAVRQQKKRDAAPKPEAKPLERS